MRKTFVSNLLLLLALNLLVKPFYILGVEAEIQNRVGPEIFGSYFALISFSFLLNILPDLGTTNWNTRTLARDPDLAGKHLPRLLGVRLLLAAAYLVVILLCGLFLGYSPEQLHMLSLLAINQVLASSVLFVRSNLSGLHLFRQDSLLSVLDRLLLVGALSWLLWGQATETTFDIHYLVWAQFWAYLLTLAAGLVLVYRRTGRQLPMLDKGFISAALRESVPFATLIFIGALTYRIDSVMLERMTDARETGIYAMGFRFFESVNMIAYLFAALLLPLFSRMIRQRTDLTELVSLSFRLLFTGCWIGCIAAWCWNLDILEWFYHGHAEEAAPVFVLLMAGSIAFSLQYIYGTLLTANGNLRDMIRIALAGLLINVVLNAILIPAFGALGSAIALLCAQSVVLLAQAVRAHTLFSLHMHRTYVRTTAFTLLAGVCGPLLAWTAQGQAITGGRPAFAIAVFILSSLLLALLTRMLGIRAFFRIIRTKD